MFEGTWRRLLGPPVGRAVFWKPLSELSHVPGSRAARVVSLELDLWDDGCEEEEEEGGGTVAGNYDALACVGARWRTPVLSSTHGDGGRKGLGARGWLWSSF